MSPPPTPAATCDVAALAQRPFRTDVPRDHGGSAFFFSWSGGLQCSKTIEAF